MTSVILWVPSLPLIYLMYRQLSNDASSKKKKAKKAQVTRFANVAGVDTAKAELMEVRCNPSPRLEHCLYHLEVHELVIKIQTRAYTCVNHRTRMKPTSICDPKFLG